MTFKGLSSYLQWKLRKTGRFFLSFYDNLTWKPKRSVTFEKLLKSYERSKSFFFVQVGANDGITGDDLHGYIKRNEWQGILVEPVPTIFERLKENYKESHHLILENSAIGKQNGSFPFYSIAEYNNQGVKNPLFSTGIDQLGSFDKNTILNHSHLQSDFESFIKEIDVPTITLNGLFSKYSVKHIDLLQIDAEGYDFEILINANFGTIKPTIIIFEHIHISRKQYKMLIKKFKAYKYNFFVNGWDTICLLS